MRRKVVVKKRFTVPALLLVIAAIAVIVVGRSTSPSYKTYAEQLGSQSLHAVTSLSQIDQQDLNLHINGNAKAELTAALAAKDLQTISNTTFQKLSQQTGSVTTHASAGTSAIKYLEYTDRQGTRHIIGIGKDDLPTMILVYHTSVSNSESKSTSSTSGGNITNTTNTSTSTNSSSTSVINDSNTSTQCTGSDGQTPICTTTGSTNPGCTTTGNSTTCESHTETDSSSSSSSN